MDVMPSLRRIAKSTWYYTRDVLLSLCLLLPFALYHQRWVEGYWHYRDQYKIASVHGQTPALTEFLQSCNHTLNEQRMWPRTQFAIQWYFYQRCEGARDGRADHEGKGFPKVLWTGIQKAGHTFIYFISSFILRIGQVIKYFFVDIIWHGLTFVGQSVWDIFWKIPGVTASYNGIAYFFSQFIWDLPEHLHNFGSYIYDSREAAARFISESWKTFWEYISSWPKMVALWKALVDFVKIITWKDILYVLKIVGGVISTVPETAMNFTKSIINNVFDVIVSSPEIVWVRVLADIFIFLAFLAVLVAGFALLNFIRNNPNHLVRKSVKYLGYILVALSAVISWSGFLVLIEFIWSIDWAGIYTLISWKINAVFAEIGQSFYNVAEKVGTVDTIVLDGVLVAIAFFTAAIVWRHRIRGAIEDFDLLHHGYVVFTTLFLWIGYTFILKTIVEFIIEKRPIAEAGLILAAKSFAGLVLITRLLLCLVALYWIIFHPMDVTVYLRLINLSFPRTRIGLAKVYTVLLAIRLLSLGLISRIIPPPVFHRPTGLPQWVQLLVDASFRFWNRVGKTTDIVIETTIESVNSAFLWVQKNGRWLSETLKPSWNSITSSVGSVILSVSTSVSNKAIAVWEFVQPILATILLFIQQVLIFLAFCIIKVAEASFLSISIWLWLAAVIGALLVFYQLTRIVNLPRAARVRFTLIAAHDNIQSGNQRTRAFAVDRLNRARGGLNTFTINAQWAIVEFSKFSWHQVTWLVVRVRYALGVLFTGLANLLMRTVLIPLLPISTLVLWIQFFAGFLYRCAGPWWNGMDLGFNRAGDVVVATFCTVVQYVQDRARQVWAWLRQNRRTVVRVFIAVLAFALFWLLLSAIQRGEVNPSLKRDGTSGIRDSGVENRTDNFGHGSTTGEVLSNFTSAGKEGSKTETSKRRNEAGISRGSKETGTGKAGDGTWTGSESGDPTKGFGYFDSRKNRFSTFTESSFNFFRSIWLPIANWLWYAGQMTFYFLRGVWDALENWLSTLLEFLKETMLVIPLWSFLSACFCFWLARRLNYTPFVYLFVILGAIVAVAPLIVIYNHFSPCEEVGEGDTIDLILS